MILSYVRWANSKTESLGSNTRRLLHGFKGLETYKKRFATVFGDEAAREEQQSNGHLMRCCPLALIDDPAEREAAIHFDCGITFAEGMRSVVGLGGDTDTNGCILGALLGARFGLGRMQAEALVGNFS